MAVGLFSVSALAADPSLEVVCPEKCSGGDTISVDIMADGITNCCAVSFHLSYDPELMEPVDFAKADSLSGWFDDNYVYTPGDLAVALAGSAAADLSGKIATVTFELKASAKGEAAFALSQLEAFTPESASITLGGVGDSTTISSMTAALLTVSPAAGENGEIVFNIDLSKAANYCGLSFVLNYDSSRYTATAAAKTGDFASSLGFVNPNYVSGKVFVSAMFGDNTSLNGRIATVTLTPVAGTSGAVEEPGVEITNFINASYEQLEIDWTYCPTALNGLADDGSAVSAEAAFANFSAADQKVTAVMALYSAEGRFLGVDMESLTVTAGSCGSFPLSVKSSGADYARLYFLNESYRPIAADIRQSLSEG